MSNFSKAIAGAVAVTVSLLPLTPARAYLPEQRPGWCKNEIPTSIAPYLADIAITQVQGDEIAWRIRSTGRTGKCIFNAQNEFVRLVVDSSVPHYQATGQIYWNSTVNQWIGPDGLVCHTCTPENGFPTPPPTQGNIFYFEGTWHDQYGVCHSCTPANGFPSDPQQLNIQPTVF
ncbi:MAG: hypothetical protein AAGF24_06575 [Cyanobacteria bacterium P01_H01_bin.121]